MNCYNIVIIALWLLFFNATAIGAEIGFIQDNKGRKWQVFQDNNTMFAQRENEKVKIACYRQYNTPKLSKNIYVLYLIEGFAIKNNELVSSQTSLDI